MVARPSIYDDEVIRAVAEKLASRVMEWDPNSKYDLAVEDIHAALDTAFEYDAYDITRILDDKGWKANADLVHVFEVTVPLAINERDRLTELWVKSEGIKPAFKLGDRVRSKRRKGVEGEITQVNDRYGRYLLFNPDMGHVRTGTGTHGIYENFEDVEEVTK